MVGARPALRKMYVILELSAFRDALAKRNREMAQLSVPVLDWTYLTIRNLETDSSNYTLHELNHSRNARSKFLVSLG